MQVIGVVDITTLTNRQYCVILDPVGEDGKPQLGQKKLIKGEKSFFLHPGEKLENGIQDIYIMGEDEGLILKANETFKDTSEEDEKVRNVFLLARGGYFIHLTHSTVYNICSNTSL